MTEAHYNAQGHAYKWTDGVYENNAPRATYRTITGQDARGHVTGETLGAGVVRTARAFNAKTGRIESITAEDRMDRQVQALTYAWDRVGNLTERGETSVGKTLTETFTYDTLSRLTRAQVGSNTAQTVSYDALGNITNKSDVGNYTYGATRPHAVTRAGSHTYTYDANGNQTGGGGRTLAYTAFNKVKSVTQGAHTTRFLYGPDRARYKRTDAVVTGSGTSTTTTLYLGNVEKITAPDGSYKYKRYLADGVLIEQTYNTGGTRTGESTRYLLYDHLGSVDVITNHLGAVTQDMSFDAWGQRRAPDAWTVLALLRLMDTTHGRITRYGFTGHEMLDATGIIHMNGRVYDPALGRFLQADPVIQFPHHSQGWNRYSYVLNNPLNATDPTGYILGIVGGIIGGAIGFITCGPACAVKGAAIGAGLGSSAEVLVRGGSLGQALLAGVSAAAFTYAAGSLFPGLGAPFGEVLLYGLQMGVVGGITTTLQGGNFGNGFLVAGTAALVGGSLARSGWFRNLSKFGKFVTSTVAGGTVSRITGGKFANGALTAAFAFMLSSAAKSALTPESAQTQTTRVIQQNDINTTIELRHNRIVPWLGPLSPKHAYVIVTDHVTGIQTIYRAGPALNLLRHGAFGDILAEYGDYVPGAPDWTTSPASSQVVLQSNISASVFNTQLTNFVTQVNMSNIPYQLLSQNSNSFAYQALGAVGIERPLQQRFAPASQTELNLAY